MEKTFVKPRNKKLLFNFKYRSIYSSHSQAPEADNINEMNYLKYTEYDIMTVEKPGYFSIYVQFNYGTIN